MGSLPNLYMMTKMMIIYLHFNTDLIVYFILTPVIFFIIIHHVSEEEEKNIIRKYEMSMKNHLR